MMRLLHLADVHLGASMPSFGELAQARRDAVLDAFRRLPGTAEREGAHALLVAGDLYDGPRPTDECVAVAREALRGVAAAGVPVFLVPGNHDALTLGTSAYDRLPDAVHVFREPAFSAPVTVETPAGALSVSGFAYDPARVADPLSGYDPPAADGMHVVLLHGSVQDAEYWEGGRSLRLGGDALAELASRGADYIALGDHHRFRPPVEFAGAEPAGHGPEATHPIPACYPGSFAALDPTEHGMRGYVLADLTPDRAVRVRHRPSGVRPLCALAPLDVSTCEDAGAIADLVAAHVEGDLPGGAEPRTPATEPQSAGAEPQNTVAARAAEPPIPIVTLVGEPSFPVDRNRVVEHLNSRYGLAFVQDETTFFDSERIRELASEPTIRGHLARLGRERIEAAGGDEPMRKLHDRALRVALAALTPE